MWTEMKRKYFGASYFDMAGVTSSSSVRPHVPSRASDN